MKMEFLRKLPTPKEIKELYPLSEELALIKQKMMKKFKKYLKEKVINLF